LTRRTDAPVGDPPRPDAVPLADAQAAP
jgi:hypothetical protein